MFKFEVHAQAENKTVTVNKGYTYAVVFTKVNKRARNQHNKYGSP